MTRALRNFALQARKDLSKNRATQVMVLILVLMIAGLIALAVSGNEFGLKGLSFVAGGLLGGASVTVAAQDPKFRKPALVLGVAALPVWITLGIIGIAVPGLGWLDVYLGGSSFESNAAAAVQGFATCATIQGMIGLFGPNRQS